MKQKQEPRNKPYVYGQSIFKKRYQCNSMDKEHATVWGWLEQLLISSLNLPPLASTLWPWASHLPLRKQ